MNKIRYIYSTVVAISMLFSACFAAHAQGLYSDVVNGYDDVSSINSLSVDFGNIDPANITWDQRVDAAGLPTSGSASIVVSYTGATNEGFELSGNWGNNWPGDFSVAVDATYYTNLSFDIHLSTNSSLSKASGGADFGSFQVDLQCVIGGIDFVPVPIGSVTIPASATNGWFHAVVPIDPSDTRLLFCEGWDIHQTSDADHATNMTFWLDNLVLKTSPPLDHPTMMPLHKVANGLWLSTSAIDPSRTSQNISSTSGTWVGSGAPVSYSMTIADFPPLAGFEAHIILVGNGWNGSLSDPSVLSSAQNVAYLQVLGNGDGSATASFMFKTNTLGDGPVFTNNTLAVLTSFQVLGTWTLAFSSDTAVTLTAPDGSITNFVFPAAAAAYFDGSTVTPNYALFGIQPNLSANLGASAIFSKVKMSLGATDYEPILSAGALDANWTVAAGDPAGVLVIPSDAAYWVSWTLPARSYVLQVSGELINPFWTDLDTLTPFVFDGRAQLIVPQSVIDANSLQSRAFFRLDNYGH